jgi:hypothetical protein
MVVCVCMRDLNFFNPMLVSIILVLVFVLDLHHGKTKYANMLGLLPCLKGLCYVVAHECCERKQLFNI